MSFLYKLWVISLTPQTLATFASTPLIFKNSHLLTLNFKKFSLTHIRTN
jgi:predicted exporter